MKLIDQFYKYIDVPRKNRKSTSEKVEDDYIIVSFIENETKYKISLVFYNNDIDVEIYIQAELNNYYDELDKIKKLNRLNCDYDYKFIIDENHIIVKSLVNANKKILPVMEKLDALLELTKEEFSKIMED